VRKTRTSWLGLSLRTVRTHAGMYSIFGLTVLLASLVTSAVVGYLALSATQQATEAIAGAGADGQRFVLVIPTRDDTASQLRAVDGIVSSLIDASAMTVRTTTTSVDGRPSLTVEVRPDDHGFTAAAIPGLVDGFSRLQRELAADPVAAPSGVSTEGTLPSTLADIQARLSIEQAATGIPVALAAILALGAIAQGSRLLVETLRDEFSLARSRGASVHLIASTTLTVATIVAALGAALGLACAYGTAMLVFGTATAGLSLVPAVAVTVAASATVLAEAVRVARGSTTRSANRAGFAANLTVIVFVFVATAVALGQLLVRRTPLQVSATGVSYVDPLIAAAPALAALATVIVGLTGFAPVARAIEALSVRGRGASIVYPARYLARRTALHIASATVVALAVASFVIAGAFTATSQHLADVRQQLAAGSDLRVTGIDPRAVPVPDSLRMSATVLVSAASVGTDTIELLAVPHDAISAVMTTAGGLVDTAALADALPEFTGGLTMPDGQLGLEVTSAQSIEVTAVTADLVDPTDGTVVTIALPTTTDSAYLVVQLGLDVECLEASCDVVVHSPTVGADAVTPQADSAALDRTVTIPFGQAQFRYRAVETPATVPAVVTTAFAARLALGVGDTVTVDVGSGSRQFTATVARIVDLIPGTSNERAMAIDLGSGAVATQLESGSPLAANELWFRSDDEAASSASLAGYSVVTNHARTDPSTATVALWLGAVGAAALAILALAAGAALAARSRRSEPGLLRAIGMSSRQVGMVAAAEHWLVVVISLALGVIAGIVVSALTVPTMARASFDGISDALPAPLTFDLAPVALAVGLTGIAFMVVGALAGIRMSRSSDVQWEGQ
jgi:hypothetical protein